MKLQRAPYFTSILGDESSLCEELELFGGCHVADGIREIAEAHIPTSSAKLWEKAQDIDADINEALLEIPEMLSIEQILRHGYFVHYQNFLIDSLYDVCYNVLVEFFNNEFFKLKLTDEEKNNIEVKMDYLAFEFEVDNDWGDLEAELCEYILAKEYKKIKDC